MSKLIHKKSKRPGTVRTPIGTLRYAHGHWVGERRCGTQGIDVVIDDRGGQPRLEHASRVADLWPRLEQVGEVVQAALGGTYGCMSLDGISSPRSRGLTLLFRAPMSTDGLVHVDWDAGAIVAHQMVEIV